MATLREALGVSEAQLTEARAKRREYADRIEALKATWMQLQAKKDLAATVEGLRITDVSNHFSEVGARIDELQKQMRVQNDLIDRQIQLARKTTVGIDYSGPRSPKRDARRALAELLDPKPAIRYETAGEAAPSLSLESAPIDAPRAAHTMNGEALVQNN